MFICTLLDHFLAHVCGANIRKGHPCVYVSALPATTTATSAGDDADGLTHSRAAQNLPSLLCEHYASLSICTSMPVKGTPRCGKRACAGPCLPLTLLPLPVSSFHTATYTAMVRAERASVNVAVTPHSRSLLLTRCTPSSTSRHRFSSPFSLSAVFCTRALISRSMNSKCCSSPTLLDPSPHRSATHPHPQSIIHTRTPC